MFYYARMPNSKDFFFRPMTLVFEWLHKRLWIFFLAVLIFLGSMGVSTVYRGSKPPYRTDFTVFKRAAEAVVLKQNIYDAKTERHWNYVYLPLLAVLAVPLHYTPLPAGIAFWYLLSCVFLFLIFRISMRLARDDLSGFKAACAASFLTIPAFLNTLTRGQLGILSLYFAVLVFYLYVRKQDFWAGFALAFAVVLKSSPLAALGFFFLFKREWRVIAGGLAGTFIFLIVIPGSILGFKQNWEFILEYQRIISHAVSDLGHQGMLWQQLVTPFAEDNQSLYAVLTRLKWNSEAAYVAASNNQLIRSVIKGLFILSLAALAVIGHRGRNRRSTACLLLEFSLYPMLMILLSPVTQPHHYTVLYLFFAGGYLYLQDKPMNRGLAAATELALLTAAFGFLFGLSFDELNGWGLSVWSSAVCWLWLSFLAWKTRRN